MSVHPVLAESLALFRAETAGLTPADLSRPTPCSAWSVAQVVRHAAGDQLGWAMVIGGTEGPAFDPFDPPAGGDDVQGLVTGSLAVAEQVWAGVPATGPAPTPLPQGPMEADLAARACALDAAVHAWDVAVAVGRPSPLTDELAAELLPAAREFVEPLRGYGVFAAEVPVPEAAGAAEALLGFLGRDAGWRA